MHGASGLSSLLILAACTAPPPGPWTAAPWPEAEGLFHADDRWRGGDAAYSVELGAGRRLWLFGDSFIARPGSDGRRGAAMVRNSIAVQDGVDPGSATMSFGWRGTATEPTSWFPEDGAVWHWPLHGVRLADAVTVFCSRVRATGDGGPFGFRAAGWTAFRITGVDGPIEEWRCDRLATPVAPFDVVVGTAVLAERDHVLAWALREPGDHAVFLARWRRDAFARGDLSAPEWFDRDAWRPFAAVTAAPAPVLADGAPEFTVVRDPGGLTMVQTVGFGRADLAVRTSRRPEGPWSAPRVVFHPPESDLDGVFVYAGKACPVAGDLLATYAANAWDLARLVADPSLYYPRCVRLTRRP